MKIEKNHSISRGLIGTNVKQIVMSKNFYTAIILAVLILLFTFCSKKFSGEQWEISCYGVCHDFFYLFYFGMMPKLIVLISALPVVTGFCKDWNTGYIRLAAGRAGVSKYMRHKVYACIAGTFITAFIALSIFTLLLRIIMPMTTEAGIANLEFLYPFGGMVEQYPYVYQFMRIICFSSFCTVWSVLGLALSAYIPNRYVVCASSFVIYYVMEQIFNNKVADYVPTWLSIPYLGITTLTTPLFGNVLLDFLYINVLFVGLALAAGTIFVHGAKRRMRNEII